LADGPILTPTELLLLDIGLEIHPILQREQEDFEMLFNIMSGQTGGTNGSREDLPFHAKDEPATLPRCVVCFIHGKKVALITTTLMIHRMTEIIVLSKSSPWITTIRNEKGVTLADLCSQLWKE
jgi:hypothetical protein